MAAADMPDFLTLYASSQPGKLAVIDDRPGTGVVAWPPVSPSACSTPTATRPPAPAPVTPASFTSPQWGEQVHATVVLAPGASLSEADVIGDARQHLGGYKCPRSVSVTGELPRTGSGKLLKRQLRTPYWAGQARQVS